MQKRRTVVELEDHGQDFTTFILNGRNEIVETKPFQGWLWNGRRVVQKHIRRGMGLLLTSKQQGTLRIKYPVKSVKREGAHA